MVEEILSRSVSFVDSIHKIDFKTNSKFGHISIFFFLADMSYKDTRTWEDVVQQLKNAVDQAQKVFKGNHAEAEAKQAYDEGVSSSKNNDKSYAAPILTATEDGMDVTWASSALVLRSWKDDIRLKYFSKAFFKEGGTLNFS